MSERRIRLYGALIASGILVLTGFVCFVQLLSCNLEDAEREGSWVFRCWVMEEQKVPAGTARIRITNQPRPISVQAVRYRTHWHPLALAAGACRRS